MQLKDTRVENDVTQISQRGIGVMSKAMTFSNTGVGFSLVDLSYVYIGKL